MSNYWKDRLLVAVQFTLMLLLVVSLDLGHFQELREVGVVLILVGGVTGTLAIWQLRHSISPFPSPKESANMINGGIFQWVRHPIYTGILFMASGYTFFSGSVWRALLTVALLILFQYKARYEERLLQGKFEDYTKYKAKTGRFLPKLRQ